MKFYRIIIYEGDEQWLKSTQARSISDGTYAPGTNGTITSYFIAENTEIAAKIEDIKEEIQEEIEQNT